MCRWRQEQYSSGTSNTNHQKQNDQQQQKQAPRFRHYGCRPISPCFVIAPEGPAKKKVAVGRF